VFKFTNPITSVDNVATSCGSVSGTETNIANETEFLVHLTGVTCNGHHVAVDIAGVHDSSNQTLDSVNATLGLLLGDTTANGIVNSSDIAQTQSQSGQPVTASNFREDVTVDGAIDSSDIALVQS